MSAAEDLLELVCKEQKTQQPRDADTATVTIQIEPTDRNLVLTNYNSGTEKGDSARGRTSKKRRIESAERCADRLVASQTRDINRHIWEDNQDNVKQLLENKDQVMKDSHGYAPVHYAAKFNRPEIMRILVEEGHADVTARTDSEGQTPLHLASCYLRHAYKPCKSAKTTETIEQLDTAEQGEIVRNRSDTLELPKFKIRRRSSAPAVEQQTSCKEIVKFLVEDCKGTDINAKDRNGLTPLHIACQSGNVEAVELLLSREDIDLTAKDGNGDTPLHEACFHGHEEIVEILLDKMKKKEKSDEARVKNDAGLTPFHIACQEDHRKIVDLLLHRCKDPESLLNECDNEGAIPLHYVCQNDNIETVKLFMDRSSVSDLYLTRKGSDGVTPMHIAAQYGCVKVMKLFLDMSFNDTQVTKKSEVVDVVDIYNKTPLHHATEYGKIDMMKLLIDSGADKEAEDIHSNTPLLTAAELGQKEGIKLLLEEEAILVNTYTGTAVQNKDRKTALFLAAEYNHPNIMKIILDGSEGNQLYKTTDTSFNTPLHISAQKGYLESIRILWNYRSKLGLKLQAKNALLKTAMHLAAENGHNSIVTELQHYWKESGHELTDTGRLLKSTDDDGNTPLHIACKHGFVDVAKTLIKMPGADIEARNKVLWTPLDCAAANGHARVIMELITAKAELDPKDKLKTTPLHLAAKDGHVTAVETLIKHGANVGLRDQRGFNALDWAIEKGHKDVAKAIITSTKWKLALRNCTNTQDGGETTPFRKLIQRMPDVAQLVLTKCTNTNAKEGTISQDSKDYAVTFSYEFIEDSQDIKEWKANKMESDQKEPVERKTSFLSWFWKKQALKHPLKIMVESKCTELLKHPLVYSLIEHKWKYNLVMVFFYFSLVCYLLFAIFLTTLALKLPNPLSPTCSFILHRNDPVNVSQLPSPADDAVMNYLINQSITISVDGIANISRQQLCEINKSLAKTVSEFYCGMQCSVKNGFLVAAPWVIIVFCCIRVIRKLFKIRFVRQFNCRHLGSYVDNIDLATFMKFPLIICTLTFIGTILDNECLCPLEWQWQVGIAAVFLAWADMVLYMRKLRFLDTGLYVLMFQSIFKTFLRVMILTTSLVVMFALAFHMTFNHFHHLFERSPFANMLDSTWKTVTMTVGEMDFDDVFHLSSGGSDTDIPPVPFPEISYILWVIFLILMPVLFTNLLVGLAVDDIKGIQEAATLTRLAMRVELILALDGELFWKLLQWLPINVPVVINSGIRNCQSLRKQRKITIYPNQCWFYSLVPKFLLSEKYNSAEYLSLELNPTKASTDQQAHNLMWEMSKIQEMLLSMKEELREVKESVHKLHEEKVKEDI